MNTLLEVLNSYSQSCGNCNTPLIMKMTDHKFVLSICGKIQGPAAYIPVVVLLNAMTEEDELTILVDSPGGDLLIAIDLVTAITNCKGTVIGIGIGAVQSAGSFIYAFCPKRSCMDGAMVMYHGPLFSMAGKGTALSDYATIIGEYVEYITQVSIAAGILSEDEWNAVKTSKSMAFISGKEIRTRLAQSGGN